MYWHRVPESDLASPPRKLWERVPVYGEPGYEQALADGLLFAVADDYLLLEVLFAGSRSPGHLVAGLVVSGGAWHPVDPAGASEDEIGVLAADEVRRVSAFLDE